MGRLGILQSDRNGTVRHLILFKLGEFVRNGELLQHLPDEVIRFGHVCNGGVSGKMSMLGLKFLHIRFSRWCHFRGKGAKQPFTGLLPGMARMWTDVTTTWSEVLQRDDDATHRQTTGDRALSVTINVKQSLA